MDKFLTITYQGKRYGCRRDETVLEALLRSRISIPFSCRNGSCHTCLMQAKSGTTTDVSQQSLKKSLRDKQYFLPCKCIPQTDLTINLPLHEDLYSKASIIQKEMLNESVCRILLEPVTPLFYHAGQFINICRPDGLVRSYSIASVPQNDVYLELHIKRFKKGEMSQWLIDQVMLNDSIEFQGPVGDCFYRNDMVDNNILLIGTGTGLAPMQGIVRDALLSNHRGEIFLYHGSSYEQGLYNQAVLTTLSQQNSNFHFHSCVSQSVKTERALHGRAYNIAFERHLDLRDWIVFSAGNSDMVYSTLEQAMAQGAAIDTVYGDPFECGEMLPDNGGANKMVAANDPAPDHLPDDPDYPETDLEMWRALDNGQLLSILLDDFYSQVYADDKLNGFFEGVTKQRAIEKQYSFLRKIFTGDDVYFGDRPRNAHHWMVISNELFDYREKLMQDCLRKYGLAEHLITRWMNMEENYRCVIVKSKAWPKVVDGKVFPLEGFDEITMEVGSLCDSCSGEINSGEVVTYHVRLGTVYCRACRDSAQVRVSKS